MRLLELRWTLARIWRPRCRIEALGPEDGPPALVIPGFVANDGTTMQLRRSLAESGWRVHPWQLGWNVGVKADIIEQLKRRLEAIASERPALVVGWSLGGVFARELALTCPDKVRAVVTLGSPFSGNVRSNNMWRVYELIAGHKVDEPPVPRRLDKPPVPTVAFWSTRDGIVAPRSARGLPHESDRTVEFRCAHMAFGVSRRTTREVAARIAAWLAEIGGSAEKATGAIGGEVDPLPCESRH
jgi:pimeloyl-ACP methyl ester carboxylesterase